MVSHLACLTWVCVVDAIEEEKIKVKQGLLSKNKATKRRVREDRPSKGVGVIEFQFEKTEDGQEDIVSAKWIADRDRSLPVRAMHCATGPHIHTISRVRKKGVFWKKGAFQKSPLLETLENLDSKILEILEILENHQTLENEGEPDHFLEILEMKRPLS